MFLVLFAVFSQLLLFITIFKYHTIRSPFLITNLCYIPFRALSFYYMFISYIKTLFITANFYKKTDIQKCKITTEEVFNRSMLSV